MPLYTAGFHVQKIGFVYIFHWKWSLTAIRKKEKISAEKSKVNPIFKKRSTCNQNKNKFENSQFFSNKTNQIKIQKNKKLNIEILNTEFDCLMFN